MFLKTVPDTFSVTGWRLVCRFRYSQTIRVLSWHDAMGCTIQRDLVAVAQSTPPKCVPSPPAHAAAAARRKKGVVSVGRLHNTMQCKQDNTVRERETISKRTCHWPNMSRDMSRSRQFVTRRTDLLSVTT